ELSHIKRGDLKIHAFYMVLQIIYWFNPLLWLARRQLQHLRELCCDATVARILREETTGYCETILETARRLLAKPVEPGMGLLGLFEDASRLATRLKWLEKKTWKHRWLQIATVLGIVSIMCACVLPMAKAEKNGDADSQSKTAFDPPEMTLEAKKSYGVGEPIELYLSWADNGWVQTTDNRAPENEGKWILFLRVNGTDYRQGEYPVLVPRYITAGVTRQGQHFHAREAYSLGPRPGRIEFPPGRYRVSYIFKDVSAARPDEPQKVVHFGDIATNEVEFDVVDADSGGTSKFVATLPNGVTVELVGVCEHPSGGKQWWRPDGSILRAKPYENSPWILGGSRYAYEFIYRVSGGEGVMTKFAYGRPFSGGMGPRCLSETNQKINYPDVESLYTCVGTSNEDSNHVDLTFLVGNESMWETVTAMESPSEKSMVGGVNNVIIAAPVEKDGKTYIDVVASRGEKQGRVIAIDKDGKQHIGRGMESSNKLDATNVLSIRAEFPMPLNRIRSIEYQTQRFTPVIFKNVSLKPNFKTDVHVEVEESKAGTVPVMARAKDVGYKDERGRLAIRLVGVRPDGGDDIYDAQGKKIAENTFANIDARWRGDSQYRTFIFELPVPDEQLLFTPFLEIRPAGGEHGLSAGQRPLVYSSDGNLTYSVGATLPRTYKRLFTRRIKQVDLTLRYYYGGRGKADFVFKGPFTPGQTIKAEGGADCELTAKEDRLNFSNHPAAFFKVSSKTRFDDDSVLLYDVSGQCHLPEGTWGRSGQYGSSYEYRAEDLTLDWIAYVTVGEKPCERTFENVVVHYP
ncbi:MAG: M56 family metallopeptidase, partial [Planctomycetota bacterium]